MESTRLSRDVLADLLGPPADRDFAIRWWDGTEDRPLKDAPTFTLVLSHPGALRQMLRLPLERSLGEAFARGDFDIEGDMEQAAGLAATVVDRLQSPWRLGRLAARIPRLPTNNGSGTGPRRLSFGSRHTRHRDAQAVRFHYDVGNEFWSLWLDREMAYSCAYFESGEEDLETAQEAKFDHICRKLRLQPGETLLDIGCGWGGLIQHAARRYGVSALGVTLSEPQAAFARARIAERGLQDVCRVEVRDYRDLPDHAFDKVVSVGMFEHVGAEQLPMYFRKAYALTKPGGVFLNHGIVRPLVQPQNGMVRRVAERVWRGGSFLAEHVFPGVELVPPGVVVAEAEQAGFETRDVENLREHYALTFRAWADRLRLKREEATALVGEPTYRVWQIYLAGSANAFVTGRMGIVQAVFGRPDATGRGGFPLTRAALYQDLERSRA